MRNAGPLVLDLVIHHKLRTEVVHDESAVQIVQRLRGESLSLPGHGVGVPLKFSEHSLAEHGAFEALEVLIEKEEAFRWIVGLLQQAVDQEIFIDGATHPFRIFQKTKHQLIVTAEKSVHLLDATTLKSIKTMPLSFETKIAGEDSTHVYLFDSKGGMYSVDPQLMTIQPVRLPFSQAVTTYDYDPTTGDRAFGTIDGTIFLIKPSGKILRLVGHRSRISRVNQWIATFSISKDRQHIWTGGQNGNLNYTVISAELMADKVQANLKRKFTKEEWDFYIGSVVADMPYDSYLKNGL